MTTATLPPHDEQIRLSIEGMHCAGCSGKVESALRSVPGVTLANVSLSHALANVRGSELDVERLVRAVHDSGFEAKVAPLRAAPAEQRTAIEQRQHRAATAWRNRFLFGAIASIPMLPMHFGMEHGLPARESALDGLEAHAPGITPFVWLIALLSTAVQVYVGGAFYASAWRAAKARSTNMDTLVSLGATAAYVFSVVIFVMILLGTHVEQPLYFGESAALLTLISLGHWLEARTSAAAGSAIRELLALQPDEVTVLIGEDSLAPGSAGGSAVTANDAALPKADHASLSDERHPPAEPGADRDIAAHREIEIPSANIQPGDLMLIRAGQRIAVDGEIVSGRSTLDESIVTGESMPVERGEGEPVVAGAMNLIGRLIVRATTDGRDTTVARIADMVRQAQTSKAKIQKLADYISSIFVPLVISIAIVTFFGWWLIAGGYFGVENALVTGLIAATTVLIISCPCALGLATPTAVMAGSGAASMRGILVRSAVAMERTAKVNTVMFDKTGTLTIGRPVVVEYTNEETLHLAAALAKNSTHPLSVAILDAATEHGLPARSIEPEHDLPARARNSSSPASSPLSNHSHGLEAHAPVVSDVTEQAGRGLSGTIDGARVELISQSAAAEAGFMLPEDDSGEALTRSVVLRDGRLIGSIAFKDTIRPEMRELVATLQAQEIEVILLTGDRASVASTIAQEVGLEPSQVKAEMRPEDKLRIVREAAGNGRVVAMVGDGINDAAALAEAGATGGIGIAIGTGANIAIEAADVVIPGENLHHLVELLHIGRQSLRTIKQNLFFSFLYNTSAIPLAALGMFGMRGPMIAAAAMAASDLCVIGNSLRLKWRLGKRTP